MKNINFDEPVANLIEKFPNLKNILKDLGFTEITGGRRRIPHRFPAGRIRLTGGCQQAGGSYHDTCVLVHHLMLCGWL